MANFRSIVLKSFLGPTARRVNKSLAPTPVGRAIQRISNVFQHKKAQRFINRVTEDLQERFAVSGSIHTDDLIFQYLINHADFRTPDDAVLHYFSSGRESALNLLTLVKELGFTERLSVLEFASGYGCVSRHLPVVLPEAQITSCDIHANAVRFLAGTLRLHAISSTRVPDEFSSPETYDVVFSLSFFSHMPRRTWGRWLAAQYGLLNSGGALIFTTHGLDSMKLFYEPVLSTDGYWFEPQSEQSDLDATEYGSTIVTRDFVERESRSQLARPIHLFRPGFWWGHQDLYVITKPNRG